MERNPPGNGPVMEGTAPSVPRGRDPKTGMGMRKGKGKRVPMERNPPDAPPQYAFFRWMNVSIMIWKSRSRFQFSR